MQLVNLNDGQEDNFWDLPMDFDPAFQMVASGNIKLTTKKSRELTQSHLAFCIARSPGDLLNHTRRIVLEFESGDSERLYGAFQDLFIALDGRGLGLKKKLLEKAKTRLAPEDFAALESCLDQGGGDSGNLPHSLFSVLGKGVVGTGILMKVTADKLSNKMLDPREEARTCIIYSQVEEARLILEKAILDEPRRLEIHQDLLEIYQSTRDHENFRLMHGRLTRLGNPLPNAWDTVATTLCARRTGR